MKLKLTFLFFAFYLVQSTYAQKAKSFDVQSPDGNIKLHVETSGKIVWSVKDRDQTIIEPSPVSLQLQNEILGDKEMITSAKTEKVNNTITAIHYIKATIPDIYNQLTIKCKGDYGLIFRVYNDLLPIAFLQRKKIASSSKMKKRISISPMMIVRSSPYNGIIVTDKISTHHLKHYTIT